MAFLLLLTAASAAAPPQCATSSLSLFQRIELHEGRRLCPYEDSLGNLTVGVGHLLRRPAMMECWTHARVDHVFAADVRAARRYARLDAGDSWLGLPRLQRDVLTELAFQLGGRGLAMFTRMLGAISARDYEQAAADLLASRLARQTPARTRELACLLASGGS